jgi:hypothetical protein
LFASVGNFLIYYAVKPFNYWLGSDRGNAGRRLVLEGLLQMLRDESDACIALSHNRRTRLYRRESDAQFALQRGNLGV